MNITLEQRLNRLSLLLDELEYEIGKTLNEIRGPQSRGSTGSNPETTRNGLNGIHNIFSSFAIKDFEDILEVSEDWEDDAQDIYDTLFNILVSKQNDYGPDNIRLAPGGPLNGLRVRLYDKIARLSNLIDTGATPENESLRDTMIDIANYGVIGVMILDDTFPKSKDN
jgi:hypothetical protein